MYPYPTLTEVQINPSFASFGMAVSPYLDEVTDLIAEAITTDDHYEMYSYLDGALDILNQLVLLRDSVEAYYTRE